MDSVNKPEKPTIVRTDIDHSLFVKTMNCSYIDMPTGRIREVQKKLHDEMVTLPKFKPLIPIEGCTDKKRLIIQQFKEGDEQFEKIKKLVNDEPEVFNFQKDHKIDLKYENYTMTEAIHIIFKALLPKEEAESVREMDVPKGFETIGDIAHLNLSKIAQPLKFEIGQVVLDKNPKLRTVVCKVG